MRLSTRVAWPPARPTHLSLAAASWFVISVVMAGSGPQGWGSRRRRQGLRGRVWRAAVGGLRRGQAGRQAGRQAEGRCGDRPSEGEEVRACAGSGCAQQESVQASRRRWWVGGGQFCARGLVSSVVGGRASEASLCTTNAWARAPLTSAAPTPAARPRRRAFSGRRHVFPSAPCEDPRCPQAPPSTAQAPAPLQNSPLALLLPWLLPPRRPLPSPGQPSRSLLPHRCQCRRLRLRQIPQGAIHGRFPAALHQLPPQHVLEPHRIPPGPLVDAANGKLCPS